MVLIFVFLVSNRKFVELYTEDLAGFPVDEHHEKRIELGRIGMAPLFYLKENIEHNAKCLPPFERTANSGWAVFETLDRFFVENKYSNHDDLADFEPTNRETLEELRELLSPRKASSHSQTFAFGAAHYEVFFTELVLPIEFQFLKGGSDRLGPETRSMISFELLLPFNNRNGKEENCVPAKNLPWFYKNKGENKFA